MMWISGKDLKQISITGTGEIDGNGIAFMGKELDDSYELKPVTDFDPRPHVLTLINAEKTVIRDITIRNSAYWTIPVSYTHLDVYKRQVSVGYTFGKIGNWINSLKLYATCNNVFTITGYSGRDPEINLGGLEPGMDLSLIHIYKLTEPTSLQLEKINCIIEDHNGTIWLGANGRCV